MASRASAASGRSAEPIGLPTIGDGAGVLILLNSDAGKAVIRLDPRPTLTERLPRAVVRMLDPDQTLDDAVAAAMASGEPPRVLGIFGGDGSVSRMAHLALRYDRPLLGIPGGTFNHFLRAAGVEDVDAAIGALETGSGLAVTVGEVGTSSANVTVLNMASVGIYPQFLAERMRRKDRLGKWIGGLSAAWRATRSAQSIDVAIDGERMRVWSVSVGVGRHTRTRPAMMRRDTLSDDRLEVRALTARTSSLRAVASLSFGRTSTSVLGLLRMLPSERDTRRLTVSAVEIALDPDDAGATFWVHDGELERRPSSDEQGRAVLACRVLPRALRLYAPPPR